MLCSVAEGEFLEFGGDISHWHIDETHGQTLGEIIPELLLTGRRQLRADTSLGLPKSSVDRLLEGIDHFKSCQPSDGEKGLHGFLTLASMDNTYGT